MLKTTVTHFTQSIKKHCPGQCIPGFPFVKPRSNPPTQFNILLNPKYMSRHKLSSAGSTQPALKRLMSYDLVDKRDDDGRYHVIDPFFAIYLAKQA